MLQGTCLFFSLSTHLFSHLSICSPIHLASHPLIYPYVHLSFYHLSICLFVYLLSHSSILVPIPPYVQPPNHPPTCPSTHLFFCPFIYPLSHTSIYPHIYSYICPSIYPPIYSSIHSFTILLSLHSSIHPPTLPSTHMIICMPIHVPIFHPSIYMIIYPSTHLSIHSPISSLSSIDMANITQHGLYPRLRLSCREIAQGPSF